MAKIYNDLKIFVTFKNVGSSQKLMFIFNECYSQKYRTSKKNFYYTVRTICFSQQITIMEKKESVFLFQQLFVDVNNFKKRKIPVTFAILYNAGISSCSSYVKLYSTALFKRQH